MKRKKQSLPLAAPKHRMVLAADVWLKRRNHTAEDAETAELNSRGESGPFSAFSARSAVQETKR